MCGGRCFFLRLHCQFRRESNPGDSARTAHGEDLSAVDFGRKLAIATPQKSASPLTRFANVRCGPSARSIPPDGVAVAVLPTSSFAQFLRRRLLFPPERSKPAETKKRRLCRNDGAAQLLRRRSFAFHRNEKCRRTSGGGDSSKAALRLIRGRPVFLRPGGQSRRTKHRGDSANAAREVESSDFFAIVVISPPEWPIPVRRKPRRDFPNGAVAQSYRNHWSAFRQNDKAPPEK